MAKITTLQLKEMKARGEKIVMLTAYDYQMAQIVDTAGAEMILVGDSLGMVVLGYENTLAVTLADMIHHGKAVVRGTTNALVVMDMPFLTYQVSVEDAVRNAGRLIQETGAQAVKLEGGSDVIPQVKAVTAAGIPVMGHLGRTPQSVGQLGGYKVQGKDLQAARQMIADASALQEAGAFSLVLECVPTPLASLISSKLEIPVIGIGAGNGCDGQVLVYHDVLGLQHGIRPKFVRRYAELEPAMIEACKKYAADVKDGSFPGKEHSFSMPEQVLQQLKEE